jgi:hypothetical protein
MKKSEQNEIKCHAKKNKEFVEANKIHKPSRNDTEKYI